MDRVQVVARIPDLRIGGRAVTPDREFTMRGIVVVTLGIALLACSGISEQVGEQVAEQVLEAQTDANVDLNLGNGQVTVKGEDGASFTLGDNQTLPEGWPKELTPPSGAKAQAVAKSPSANAPGKSDYMATFANVPPCDVTMKTFQTQLAGWSADSEARFDQTVIAVYGAPDKSATASITCSPSDDGTTTVIVTYAAR